MAKILIVDDEVNIIKTISSILQDENHTVFSSETGNDAIDFLKNDSVDLVILDVWLPDKDGIEVLKEIKKMNSDPAVIMISGHGSIDIAVKSTKIGAYDFISKPPSLERVVTSVNNALEQVRLKKENIKLREGFIIEDEMVGTSRSIAEIFEVIKTAAQTNARVFITGESGTGKELIARAIYLRSKRSDKPFIKVNCAAIPDDLIESELFGHEKGAFTGAIAQRKGKFEVADGGTIFLDEVCDMSLSAQTKVLRVLQENQFERVGGNQLINIDVRVISATNIDVMKAIEEGKFREDLFYRLNVIPIHASTLSVRKDDIPLLVDYFLKKFSKEHGIGLKEISKKGMKFLINYQWPGNIRELKNIIERILIMIPKEVIDLDDIKKHLSSDDLDDLANGKTSTLKKVRQDFEKKYIVKTLKENNKNITNTAKALGIERTNLHRKINLYNINIDNI
ncbi:sigma-54-dependent transcriptional regulator [Spirochaetota bacterium]